MTVIDQARPGPATQRGDAPTGHDRPGHVGVPGAVIAGRYTLRGRLGAGATGQVWLARDGWLGRDVAVKEVPGPGESEARAAARVNHRSVVKVHDFVTEAGRDWIVLEALAGHDMAEVLREHGPLAPAEVRVVAVRLLSALRAVHQSGLVHGDVKPANVHLCDNGRVVLTDFGLAAPPRRTGGARYGPIAGSLPFMAPELLTEGAYAPASDLFALGLTLRAALLGRLPRTGDPRPGGEFGRLIGGLLRPDPAERLTAGAAALLLRR